MSTGDGSTPTTRPPGAVRWSAVLGLALLMASACTPAAPPPDPDPPTSTSGTTQAITSTPAPTPTTTPATTTPATTTPVTSQSSAAPDPLVIGLVAPSDGGTFGQEAAASIVTELDAAGAIVVSCDPGEDHAQLLTCVRRMSAQQVDGWILLPETELGELQCDTALPTVPMITVGAPTGCELAVVGPDDEQAGRTVGQQLAARARDGAGCDGSVLVVIGNAAAPRSAARADGITTGYAASCPTADPVLVDATGQEQAYVALETALAAIEPDTDVLIGAVEDGLALGALAAVPDSRAEEVAVAGIGADLRARCALREDPRWIGDAAFFANRYGAVVVPALLDAIDGRRFPTQLTIESEFIDADSVGTYYPELECPTS